MTKLFYIDYEMFLFIMTSEMMIFYLRKLGTGLKRGKLV